VFCITAARVLHVSLTREKTEKANGLPPVYQNISSSLAPSMIENLQRQSMQRAHLLYKIVHSVYIVQQVESCSCEKRVPAGWQEFQILNICMQGTNYHPYVLCQPVVCEYPCTQLQLHISLTHCLTKYLHSTNVSCARFFPISELSL